ncbi:hypothetical protein EHP00_1911 [Ecytonucleospora hepatopenaei]|uniref:Uncharacterized protein n=1 Tax=Ecytonucleospora hepatopenaei TaxID=646526 RepID=A0A1W0E2A9_9MICR|nr:hypothetical protein EHP00_1911 [Ecytonucleospora hepatopenaei]
MKFSEDNMAPQISVNDTFKSGKLLREVKILMFEIKWSKASEEKKMNLFFEKASEELKEYVMEMQLQVEGYSLVTIAIKDSLTKLALKEEKEERE